MKRLAYLAFGLAFCVTLLGAYVRLSNAGLGCPDWPGCYGKLIVPSEEHALNYPERPLEKPKAWKEMAHRYLAGSLGLLTLVLWALSVRSKKQLGLASAIVLVIIFQALLGMWTVTLKLHPLVVTAHLLGGFTTLGLLWVFALRCRGEHKVRPYIIIGLIILILQITLGGLTSSNYAALACPDFPTCRGEWAPQTDVPGLLHAWSQFDADHEYGIATDAGRVTVHWLHRLGAAVALIYLLGLGVWLTVKRVTRRLGLLLCFLIILQAALGVANVLMIRPLPLAVAHNGVAAALLLCLITIAISPVKRTSQNGEA